MRTKSNMPEFTRAFKTRHQCLKYLCELKWGSGFRCRRCGCNESIKGKTWYYKKCRSCKKEESCTAHTLFHKLKFPVTTAFLIAHQLSTHKKGMSCAEISRQFNIHQKTAWFFKAKVQRAMAEKNPIRFTRQLKKCQKLSVSKPKDTLVVELKCSTSAKNKAFIEGVFANFKWNEKLSWGKARWSAIRNDKSEIRESKKGFNIELKFCNSDGRRSTNLYILNLKNWLSGIHHLVSLAYLERYLKEFEYRYDRRQSLSSNSRDLLKRLVDRGKFPYKWAKLN